MPRGREWRPASCFPIRSEEPVEGRLLALEEVATEVAGGVREYRKLFDQGLPGPAARILLTQGYQTLGDLEEARALLDGILAGDERVEWFERDPHFKNIRDLPTFKQIVAPLHDR